jgi:hypothetical protein
MNKISSLFVEEQRVGICEMPINPAEDTVLLCLIDYADGTSAKYRKHMKPIEAEIEAECHRLANLPNVVEVEIYRQIFWQKKSTSAATAIGERSALVKALLEKSHE